MKSKQERQRILKEVIKENKVANQEDLSNLLGERGLAVAQATLSRDIRELRISKTRDDSGYYYHLPQVGFQRTSLADGSMTADSVESIEFSGLMAVIKTLPGHANMIASIIDGSAQKEIMGTLAGDDTIMMMVREGFSHDDVCESLGKLFKGIEEKRIN